MKTLITLLTFTSLMVNVYAQTNPSPLKQIDSCRSEQELTKMMEDRSDKITFSIKKVNKKDDVVINVLLNDDDKKSSPSKRYLLKNLKNNTKTVAEAKDDTLVFKIGKPPVGVKEVFLQIIDKNDKCYGYAVQLLIDQTEGSGTISPPAIIIKTQIPGKENCESCTTPKRIVLYNFDKNELRTIWPKIKGTGSTDQPLYKRFARGLPWVNREFTFQVVNVNPFRYDVQIEDERIDFYPEIPAGLISAFTLPATLPKAAAAGMDKEDKDSTRLANDLVSLGEQLKLKSIELQNAGDCYNPCDIVQAINKEIIAYFTTVHKFNPNEGTLESFFTKKLHLDAEPNDKNKEAIKKLSEIVKAYFAFRNTGSGTVRYHIPQTQNVDQYSFKLNITPKEGITTGARVLNQEIRVDVLGGFRADASTGLFFTQLIDDKYSLYPDSTLQTDGSYWRRKKVVKENGNKMDFGVASLLHFYPKLTKGVNIGASLGAGVTLNEKPKLRYLAGGTLLLGRGNRIAITGGWAFGYIDRISDKYTSEGVNLYAPDAESSPEYKKIFHSKGFFSVTYNIPLGRRTASVSPAASTTTSEEPEDDGSDGEDEEEEEGDEDGKNKEEKKDKKDKKQNH